MGLDLERVMSTAGLIIYGFLGLLAIWGVFCVVLVARQVGRRSFRRDSMATEFLEALRDLLGAGNFDGAQQLCASPQYWYQAVPVLVRGALENRRLGLKKIRQTIGVRFEREILSDLENRMAWINTVAKSSPMVGLLGTVTGMIGAFSKMAGVDTPNPSDLAGNISVALNTTALGLIIAVPMVLAANFISIRMRKLEDATAEHMQIVLDDMENALARSATTGRRRPPGN